MLALLAAIILLPLQNPAMLPKHNSTATLIDLLSFDEVQQELGTGDTTYQQAHEATKYAPDKDVLGLIAEGKADEATELATTRTRERTRQRANVMDEILSPDQRTRLEQLGNRQLIAEVGLRALAYGQIIAKPSEADFDKLAKLDAKMEKELNAIRRNYLDAAVRVLDGQREELKKALGDNWSPGALNSKERLYDRAEKYRP